MTIKYEGERVRSHRYINIHNKPNLLRRVLLNKKDLLIRIELVPEGRNHPIPRDRVKYLVNGETVELVGPQISDDSFCRMQGVEWFPSNARQKKYIERLRAKEGL